MKTFHFSIFYFTTLTTAIVCSSSCLSPRLKANTSSIHNGTTNYYFGFTSTAITQSTGATPMSIHSVDFDGDTYPDIVTADFNANQVSFLRSTSSLGSVSFAPTITLATGAGPSSVFGADFDGDGKPDLAVAEQTGDRISVRRNTSTVGSITFAAALNLNSPGNVPSIVSAADLDGDGLVDLIYTEYVAGRARVQRNTSVVGTISFAAAQTVNINGSPTGSYVHDMDGDGKPDLLSGDCGAHSVRRNTSVIGTISFAAGNTTFPPTCGNDVIYAKDFDGDGKADLFYMNTFTGIITVRRNLSTPGTLSFASAQTFNSGTGNLVISYSPNAIHAADLNGDDKPEMIAVNLPNNQVSVFKNTSISGTISFDTPLTYSVGTDPSGVFAIDLDKDGRLDLVVSNFTSNTVTAIKN